MSRNRNFEKTPESQCLIVKNKARPKYATETHFAIDHAPIQWETAENHIAEQFGLPHRYKQPANAPDPNTPDYRAQIADWLEPHKRFRLRTLPNSVGDYRTA